MSVEILFHMELLAASKDGELDLVCTLLERKADVNFMNSSDVSKKIMKVLVSYIGIRSNISFAE